MLEGEVIKALAAGGSTALLALIIFFMYRKDRQDSEECMREDRKFMEDRLTRLLESDQASREKNTQALTELVTQLRIMNGGGRRNG